MKKTLSLFLKGCLMGAADIVPGVSGGTIALITGIYEDLIDSIDGLKLSLLPILFQSGVGAFWRAANGAFLFPLFVGIGCSIIFMSSAIDYLLDNQPILLWSFFLGLIGMSILLLVKQLQQRNVTTYLLLSIGFLIAYGITLLSPAGNSNSLFYLFFCSTIAIMAMILPGISGAFLFILLGVYEEILETVQQMLPVLATKNLSAIQTVYTKVLVIGLGIVVGLKLFSRVLKWLFAHRRHQTLSILIGFMMGALPKIWPWKVEVATHIQKNISPFDYPGDPHIFSALGTLAFGAISLFLVQHYVQRK